MPFSAQQERSFKAQIAALQQAIEDNMKEVAKVNKFGTLEERIISAPIPLEVFAEEAAKGSIKLWFEFRQKKDGRSAADKALEFSTVNSMLYSATAGKLPCDYVTSRGRVSSWSVKRASGALLLAGYVVI